MINAQGLKEERQRLGFTQAEIAEQCGISREMWCRYERSASVPSGDVLHQFSQLGGDVQFVLSGARTIAPLTDDECRLLEAYRINPGPFNATVSRLGEAAAV